MGAMSERSIGGLALNIREAAIPLTGTAHDYDPVLDLVGDAHVVLIGEASHGTHEFYRQRAAITQRLIVEKGFTVVAVEADWPDAYRVNRYVRGINDDATGNQALSGFKRFPTWMWRNTEVLDFVEWLRQYNQKHRTKAGFYGLDLYNLSASIEAVISYLDRLDSEAAQRARARYACFDRFGWDTEFYGYTVGLDLTPSCEQAILDQLQELQHKAAEYSKRDGQIPEDEFFYVLQNAHLIKDAEVYYRSMFDGAVSSWNVRDRHMADTLDALLAHLNWSGEAIKAVVWAHNSHLGDARATSMGAQGELNVGQLVRERHGQQTRLIGQTTYAGTVTAASNWDRPAECKQVRPALPHSYEELFHHTGRERFFLNMYGEKHLSADLQGPYLERAIGVIYRPETERASHYFHARLPEQFDAVLHVDRTRALEPLDPSTQWQRGEEETFPSGL